MLARADLAQLYADRQRAYRDAATAVIAADRAPEDVAQACWQVVRNS